MKVEDAIRECYNIEDNGQSMSCIKKAIRETTDGCKPKMVLLVKEGCPGCKESKAAYKDDIKSGALRTVDIKSPEGVLIAKRNGVSTVPSYLILDCDNLAIV